jgi:hypothetical protein
MGRTVDLWTRAARSQSDLRTKAPRSIGDETASDVEAHRRVFRQPGSSSNAVLNAAITLDAKLIRGASWLPRCNPSR